MKWLKFIPISLFIIVSAVYDFFHAEKSTSWSIFFFTGMYFSLWLWVIIEAIRDKKNDLNLIFWLGVTIGVSLRIIAELQKRGMDYEKYMDSINSYQDSIIISCWTIVIIIIAILYGRRKRIN